VYAAPSPEGARPHAFEVVRRENQSRRVVDIPAALEALTVRTGVAGPSREV
jgi:hypothetical protein